MYSYPIPFNEHARLAAVKDLYPLKTGEEPVFNEIVKMVRKALNVPTALVSIVDEEKQWFAAREGFPICETPRAYSICAHAIMEKEPLVICDTLADTRFRNHPVVLDDPYIRFYAGVPIVLTSGLRVGSLCGLDYVSRDHPTEEAMSSLEGLARVTACVLERSHSINSPSVSAARDAHDAAKSTFVNLIGHELRTPLTVIFGSLKLLEATAECGQAKSLAKTARRSSEHLMSLIETIIDFADASTGELRLNERPCDLQEIIANVAELRLPRKDNTITSITLASDSAPIVAYLDPDQIKLAMSALVINAINHGGPNIRVGIERNAAGIIELWVSDNGGINKDEGLAVLEEPFIVGGEFAHRGTRGGLGLGLPLTRKLIELHGGDFQLLRKDACTRATIRLPAWRGEV